MQRDEGLALLYSILADLIEADPADLSPETRLFEDLRADSLDFVDILFEVESRFQVKLAQSELDFITRLDITDPEWVRDGFLTPTALDRIRPVLPALDAAPDLGAVKPRELYRYVTVETLWRVVQGVLARKEI